jgi:hypothetical protein
MGVTISHKFIGPNGESNLMFLNLLMTYLAAADQPSGISSVNILTLISGAVLNAGGLAWWIRSGTDMKIAQKEAAEAKHKSDEALTLSRVLESRVGNLDIILAEIRSRMVKLDKVDEMVSAVKYIEEAVTKHLVPRAELQQQWKGDNERFSRLEEDVRELKKA